MYLLDALLLVMMMMVGLSVDVCRERFYVRKQFQMQILFLNIFLAIIFARVYDNDMCMNKACEYEDLFEKLNFNFRVFFKKVHQF